MTQNPSVRLRTLLCLMLLALALLPFQNCTSRGTEVSFASSSSDADSSLSASASPAEPVSDYTGGNGVPYDFKLIVGNFDQIVPGIKCGDLYRQPDRLNITAVAAMDYAVGLDCIANSSVADLASLEYSPYNDYVVGYRGNIYGRSDNLPDMFNPDLIVTEAWCRAEGSGQTGQDFVLQVPVGKPDALTLIAVEGVIVASSPQRKEFRSTGLKRTVHVGSVTYLNPEFELNVDLGARKGTLKSLTDARSTAVNCKFGGFFDHARTVTPVAPLILGLTGDQDARVDAYLPPGSSPVVNWQFLPEAALYDVFITDTATGLEVCRKNGLPGDSTSYRFIGCSLSSGGRYAAHLEITTGENAHFSAANNPFAFAVETWNCPQGFIRIPSLSGYTSADFCAAKYEMKGIATALASTPAGLPVTGVNRFDAIAACQTMGPRYDLMTQAEWQTVARHLEAQSENWSLNTVGSSGGMARGHSDASPLALLEAAADDNQACFTTGQPCDTRTWSPQRRALRLGNGEFIWDFAGNAREWVSDHLTGLFGPSSYLSQVKDAAPFTNNPKTLFGPAGDYSALSSGNFGGLGYAVFDSHTGSAVRGGGFDDGVKSGVFSVDMSADGTLGDPSVSFRCVFHP